MIELAAESLRLVGRLRLRVTGASMLPAIRPGDILEVRERRAAGVRAGSVVLFERDGRLFAHRVVRREGVRLVTRGDALEHEDAAIGDAELLGEIVGVERGLFGRGSLAGRIFARLRPA